ILFGNNPFVTHSSEAVRKFAAELYGYHLLTEDENFEKVNGLTSAMLLVDRSKLSDKERFYRDDMTIPAAQEHEGIARFHKLGIPIYVATHINSIHNHHLELSWLVMQQYKYGLATAEAFAKVPEILEMERFSDMQRSLDFGSSRSPKMLIKRFFATRPGCAAL